MRRSSIEDIVDAPLAPTGYAKKVNHSASSHPIAAAAMRRASLVEFSMPPAVLSRTSADASNSSQSNFSASSASDLLRQRLLSLVLGQSLHDLFEFSGEYPVEVVEGETDPVVGDPVLLEVVGADLF